MGTETLLIVLVMGIDQMFEIRTIMDIHSKHLILHFVGYDLFYGNNPFFGREYQCITPFVLRYWTKLHQNKIIPKNPFLLWYHKVSKSSAN
jgi:hypothetical protein